MKKAKIGKPTEIETNQKLNYCVLIVVVFFEYFFQTNSSRAEWKFSDLVSLIKNDCSVIQTSPQIYDETFYLFPYDDSHLIQPMTW